MLLVTGESRFADLLERTLYNGFLSGRLARRRVVLLLEPAAVAHRRASATAGTLSRAARPTSCGCSRRCTTTSPRRPTTGVQLHQYATSTIRAVVPAPARSSSRSRRAIRGRAPSRSRSSRARDAEWTLSLRIPAGRGRRSVDGEPVAAGEYADADAAWRAGDRVVLELDVSPRLTAPNPRIDAVRGCVALERGPVVYCFEEHDLPAGVELADVALDPAADPVDSGPVGSWPACPAWRWPASSATSTAGGTASIATSGSCRRGVGGSDELLAVPYFAWANRDAGGMRVWIPGRTRSRRRPWRPCRSSS